MRNYTENAEKSKLENQTLIGFKFVKPRIDAQVIFLSIFYLKDETFYIHKVFLRAACTRIKHSLNTLKQ